ncbi:MAG: hypothetical protein L0H64_01025 [Pseudonocardia sp.]|nr:hypothetical protein [Pseudonocardia sp.]
MTVPAGPPSGADGRPDLELLADLDAGLLEPERAERVRAAALADPQAAAALAALTATRAELAGLPAPPVPPDVAARWAAALDAAPRRETACPEPARARPRVLGSRPRRRVAGAVLAVAAVVAGVLLARPDDRLVISRVELAAVARSTIGVDDLGGLADPATRAGCLTAVGRVDDEVLGGRRVRLDGEQALLLVLSTGTLGRFRVLVVDPACGADGGTVLAEQVIGAGR